MAARFSGGECAADRMVKIELEAAETLAALARSTDSDTSGGETRWNGGESVSHGVENELTAYESVPMSSDLDQDQAAVIQQSCEKIRNFMSKTVKVEQYVELKQNPNCNATNGSSGSCKSRQNLTEAEKESRKLRRVLANRESARQTIRRRQAFYEELTRKAAYLVLENENLKREKELAMKEYDSSKSENDFLKAQITKLAKAEEIRQESKPNNVDASTSTSTSTASTACPIFIYSQPSYSPFLWPSIVQPSNSVHPQVTTGHAGNPDSYYMLPFPWIFPTPHNDNGSCPQPFSLNYKQPESQQSSSTNEENCRSHLPVKVQTEVSVSTEPIKANKVRENPPDGGGPRIQGVVFSPAQTAGRENNLRQESGHGDKAISATTRDANGLLEKCPAVWQSKKVDAVAAAEARKRRKELTRLKNLHFRLST